MNKVNIRHVQSLSEISKRNISFKIPVMLLIYYICCGKDRET